MHERNIYLARTHKRTNHNYSYLFSYPDSILKLENIISKSQAVKKLKYTKLEKLLTNSSLMDLVHLLRKNDINRLKKIYLLCILYQI